MGQGIQGGAGRYPVETEVRVEAGAGAHSWTNAVPKMLMERVLERPNLMRAYQRVVSGCRRRRSDAGQGPERPPATALANVARTAVGRRLPSSAGTSGQYSQVYSLGILGLSFLSCNFKKLRYSKNLRETGDFSPFQLTPFHFAEYGVRCGDGLNRNAPTSRDRKFCMSTGRQENFNGRKNFE